ncbi:amine oxidase [Oleidesulfovibrio alaskensis G20]|uniref:Amine oxidase n=1 Tax=Oleidesulfovibrio alaskensis (strain ATCC BAA-1058 / DSM 17464 / G20) TaxID=207559 RepID=Q316X9_OLEA2|nr:FAD-dependent oxidoreductase [Oleidesulfovibrio alaskensis]ABB37017.1 amine oxidase [Oleidesulfovibrio alaskensis G20]
MHVKYLIIGAGPTGLGAGRRLRELGENDFLLLERNAYCGGLATSFTDNAGFTWDIGGHVVFSHYDYFDRLIESLLGDAYLEHQRIARVRIAQRWIPYPFQNNIRHLPRDMQWECVQALLPHIRTQVQPHNFRQWIEYVFGAGIARHFMLPYNFKVWATPPELMAYHWIGERVSVIDLEMVLKNLVLELDNVSWGPNNMFRFPLHGGTGEIFHRMGAQLDGHVRLNTAVVQVDPAARTVRTADGDVISYSYMLNTGPLDRLVLDCIDTPHTMLRDAAGRLSRNGVFVAGVGVEDTRDDDTCWMYFPEDDCPYYRLTNFHNYSPNNVALPGRQRALMAETSWSEHKPEDLSSLMDKTVQGLVNTAMLDEAHRDLIVSRWSIAVDYGYPVPTLERDGALRTLHPWLEEHGISSRGRFGGWKYEVANMDHSVMQGVEWAERMVQGTPETTYTIQEK